MGTASYQRAHIQKALQMFDRTALAPQPFLILRHGETDWNVVQRMQGVRDIPLNATGRAQAAAAARTLSHAGIKRILCSPLSRALETAQATATTTGARITCDNRLVERGFGALEGLTVAEVKRDYGYGDGVNFHLIDGPEIEKADAVIQRTSDAISDYLRQSTDLALIVAHGQIFTMFIEKLTGKTVRFANAKPYLAAPGPAGWSISCYDAA